ncbi:hypothetical protein [Rhizobium sp. RAF56]|uniref:hypothetical protein n=1 Tax=Rhizobium sp. RAF56 TaxID=3233062 RepID=UPI003F9D3B2F
MPDEVQSYVGNLEMALYNLKQEGAAGRAFAVSAIGALIVGLNYFGFRPTSAIWPYLIGILFLTVPWFRYSSELKKNASEDMPRDARAGTSTDELIKREWELDFIVHEKRGLKQVIEPAADLGQPLASSARSSSPKHQGSALGQRVCRADTRARSHRKPHGQSAASAISPGKLETSPNQSRNDDRNPCTVTRSSSGGGSSPSP